MPNFFCYPCTPRMHFDENASGQGSPSPAGGSPAPASPPGGGAGDGSPPQVTQLKSSIPADSSTDSGSGQGEDSFAGLDDDLDAIDLGVQDQTTGDEPGAQPAPQPGAQQTPAPQTQQQPAAQTQPQTPAQQGTQGPRSQLEFALDGFKTNHAELSQWASQNLFNLSEADHQALENDPGKIIPLLMGRVYTQSLAAATNLIKNFVPEMVSQGSAQQSARAARATEALNEFYQTNPHLNAQAHGAAVDKWARFFRGANPQASRQEAIAFVGRAVSAEFGLAPSASGRKATPFAPARPGARAQPRSGNQPHDPYAGMEDEYD